MYLKNLKKLKLKIIQLIEADSVVENAYKILCPPLRITSGVVVLNETYYLFILCQTDQLTSPLSLLSLIDAPIAKVNKQPHLTTVQQNKQLMITLLKIFADGNSCLKILLIL